MPRNRLTDDLRDKSGDIDFREHPVVKFRRIFWALIAMPTLVGLAWWKAVSFNPYTTSFFTKTYIAPTPQFPWEMRVAGWVFVAIGALLLITFAYGMTKKRLRLRECWSELSFSILLVVFGGAFFVAANSAQAHIEHRSMVE